MGQFGLFDAPKPERAPPDPGPLAYAKMLGKSERRIERTADRMKTARELADEYYARWGQPEATTT